MRWYFKVLKNYVNFRGRARRMEFWIFFFINLILGFFLALAESLFIPGDNWIIDLYWLLIALPFLGLVVRRLHDTGRTGWWALIVLIPFIGQIILMVFMTFDSEDGSNSWGPNPKEHSAFESSISH
ncbi:MAG: DUF805 domain-containing protein [Bacillota bacterium]